MTKNGGSEMVKVEDIEVMGWRKAIKGMRNPLNSWGKSDSQVQYENIRDGVGKFILGPNDIDLALRLIKAGPEHRKFLRMIHVQMDINGPLYWWKEMDTYKVGTTANSCSTMHKIATKEFTLDDFSCEHLWDTGKLQLQGTIDVLNVFRDAYNHPSSAGDYKKECWWQMIQLLPSSYNQLRTWDGSMETVLSILHQRAHHKLDTDWEPFRQACFDNIPYCKEFYEAMYGKED